MKFVTLALATLLALGCQAASLQSDAPASRLAEARQNMDLVLRHLQTILSNTADKVNDEQAKLAIKNGLDTVFPKIQELRKSAEPWTDSFVTTMTEATADLQKRIESDIAELDTQREELRKVLNNHLDAYKAKLNPIFTEYREAQQQQMDALKAKYEDLVPEMRTMITTNWEETRNALMPLLNAAYEKVNKHLESLKEMVNPYVEDYRDQASQVLVQAQAIDREALAAKATANFADLKTCLENLAAKVKEGMQ